MDNSDKFFCNKSCKFFPCHTGLNEDEFNCLFCYCPLYFLGDECGGNFKMTKSDKKDCSDCVIPHGADSRDIIIERLKSHERSK